MTVMQEMVSRFWNLFRDEDFIEMIQLLDDPEYWEQIDCENLTDEECVDVLYKLSNIYTEWNYQG